MYDKRPRGHAFIGPFGSSIARCRPAAKELRKSYSELLRASVALLSHEGEAVNAGIGVTNLLLYGPCK